MCLPRLLKMLCSNSVDSGTNFVHQLWPVGFPAKGSCLRRFTARIMCNCRTNYSRIHCFCFSFRKFLYCHVCRLNHAPFVELAANFSYYCFEIATSAFCKVISIMIFWCFSFLGFFQKKYEKNRLNLPHEQNSKHLSPFQPRPDACS